MLTLVKNGELNIDEKTWNELNSKLCKDNIKKLILSEIRKNNVLLPYQKIRAHEAVDDFYKLEKMDCKTLIKDGDFFSRYEYNIPKSNKYIDLCKTGCLSSNYFHQENRWKCDSINAPSPERTWNTDKFMMSLMNSFWTLKFKKITNSELRTAIGLRKYIASQFRPSAAKAIYQYFGGENILDTSCGWGDRLSAFMVTKGTKYYYGTDPNSNLMDGYCDQADFFLEDNKDFDIFPECSESHDYPEGLFDLSFTSPPYFIIERYTRESSQSWVRYKKIEKWLNNFLFPTIINTEKALKRGGTMAINISDVYCNHTVNNICQPMYDFISKNVKSLKFYDYWGIRMAKRINSKASKDGVFCEPLFIWKKE